MPVHLSALKPSGSNSVLHSVSSCYLNFSKLLLEDVCVPQLIPVQWKSGGQSLNFLIFVFKWPIRAFKYKSPFRNGFCVIFKAIWTHFCPRFIKEIQIFSVSILLPAEDPDDLQVNRKHLFFLQLQQNLGLNFVGFLVCIECGDLDENSLAREMTYLTRLKVTCSHPYLFSSQPDTSTVVQHKRGRNFSMDHRNSSKRVWAPRKLKC